MIIGYARVSTTNQSRDGGSIEDQVKVLKEYGITLTAEEEKADSADDTDKTE